MMDTTTRQRSDSELDRDWQPNGRRPQSTMAKHFSVALDSLFDIDNRIIDLDAAVYQKKRIVSNHAAELKALEDRLKAMEERLAASTGAAPKKEASAAPAQEKIASRPGTAKKTTGPPQPGGARPPTPGSSSEDEK